MGKELFNRLNEKEFEEYRINYIRMTSKAEYNKTLVYHVGMGAGLYSELGSMLEAVAWCYENKIKFKLYADDANFAQGSLSGWETFFEPFCEMSHEKLNHYGNYRYKTYHRIKGILVPNMIIKRFIIPFLIKRKEECEYLTQDIFQKFSSNEYHQSAIKYDLFDMNGKMLEEYAKLSALCLRYNAGTYEEISKVIASLHLPQRFISIQIRGGDKTMELDNLKDSAYCSSILENEMGGVNTNNLFIFTDDYRNIEYLQKKHEEWNIYTLCGKEERGYYNTLFYGLSWEVRRKELIKLFAMVEICISSDLHIGCCLAAVNNYIRSARKVSERAYKEYVLGEPRKRNLKNVVKRIINK